MCACRIAGRTASRPVCGKYRIAVSLREGFFLLKKKRIAELSMLYYPSEFPVSHRSVISSMGTLCVRTWNMQVFSDQYSLSMRGRLFRKRFAAWTCRFQKRFAHFFVPIEEWTYDGNWQKCAYEWNSQFKPYLLSHTRAYAHSKTECRFLAWLWVCSLHTLWPCMLPMYSIESIEQ